ncbi:MAG: YceI family protein [Phycisphaerales bacterium]|nr:MAG: YceI family protein [Phycisphaerales bacterium]
MGRAARAGVNGSNAAGASTDRPSGEAPEQRAATNATCVPFVSCAMAPRLPDLFDAGRQVTTRRRMPATNQEEHRMKSWHLAIGSFAVTVTAFSVGFAPEPTPAAGMADAYKIDPVHSTAIFRVQHFGAGQFYGRFNDVSGQFTFDGSSAESLTFDVTVKVDSVDTGTAKLDGHLKSPDFFNARENPTLTFRSKSAKLVRGATYSVTGELTIHGVTKSVTVNVEHAGTADQGQGKRCGFEAIFELQRSDYGMTYGIDRGMLGDDTRVIVSLEGVHGAA